MTPSTFRALIEKLDATATQGVWESDGPSEAIMVRTGSPQYSPCIASYVGDHDRELIALLCSQPARRVIVKALKAAEAAKQFGRNDGNGWYMHGTARETAEGIGGALDALDRALAEVKEPTNV